MKKAIIAVIGIALVITGGVLIVDASKPPYQLNCWYLSGGGDSYIFAPSFCSSSDTIINWRESPKVIENSRIYGETTDDYIVNFRDAHKNKPYKIDCSFEMKDGQTIVRFSGTVTDDDGNIVPYNDKLVFNFIIARSITEQFKYQPE